MRTLVSKTLFILLTLVLVSVTTYAEEKNDYKIAENILPGLTCESYYLGGQYPHNADFLVTVCRDAEYGCEYFRIYGGGYGNLTQTPFTLRQGSCKEPKQPTPKK